MPEERWADIPGFVGLYQASDQGRIRSLDRVIQATNREVRRKGQVLRPGSHAGGHQSVVLGRGNTRHVHTLVMLTFVGPRPPGLEILHDNHIPRQNQLSNLRYGTKSENLKADYAVGTRTTPQAWINSANGKRKVGHAARNGGS